MKPLVSCQDARLLFTLLDAVDDLGALRGNSRWTETKLRLADVNFEREGLLLLTLLTELDRPGRLGGTWIQEHWRALELRRKLDLPTKNLG
jgi:hypothetical protein